MKVLIADDDAVLRLLLEKKFLEWGYIPVIAKDGNEALQILEQANPPRLMVLDWMMPGLTGPELCQRIRSSPRTMYSYVILLTGRTEKDDVILGMDSGADAFLTKPVDMRELRSRLAAGKRIVLHQEALSSRLDLMQTRVLPHRGSGGEPTIAIPRQLLPVGRDLIHDSLLDRAERFHLNGRTYPALADIPLLCKLGEGGMSTVYLGYNPRTQCEVAVKVLATARFQNNADAVARFYREAHIAAAVKSPHLVAVSDVDEYRGIIFIVMEYVNGKSAGTCLADAFRKYKDGLDEVDALHTCLSAAKGLAAAHECGIVHRDVKPDNIIVPFDPVTCVPQYDRAKLTDLGIARQELMNDGLTSTNAVLGTIGFMPPEQIRDPRKAGKPADIFAMGATLYTLLAGRTPFDGDTGFSVFEHTIGRPHRSLRQIAPNVSEVTEAVVDRCLSKDSAQRYPDARALVSELEHAIECANNAAQEVVAGRS